MPTVDRILENSATRTNPLPLPTAKRTAMLELSDFRKYLEQFARDCGGMAELARRLGVSGEFVGLLIAGKRRPGAKILSALGARRKVMIEIEVEAE